jgi:hypothetical protein
MNHRSCTITKQQLRVMDYVYYNTLSLNNLKESVIGTVELTATIEEIERRNRYSKKYNATEQLLPPSVNIAVIFKINDKPHFTILPKLSGESSSSQECRHVKLERLISGNIDNVEEFYPQLLRLFSEGKYNRFIHHVLYKTLNKGLSNELMALVALNHYLEQDERYWISEWLIKFKPTPRHDMMAFSKQIPLIRWHVEKVPGSLWDKVESIAGYFSPLSIEANTSHIKYLMSVLVRYHKHQIANLTNKRVQHNQTINELTQSLYDKTKFAVI